MNGKCFGTIHSAAVTAIGVWNPLFPQHYDLLERLKKRARELQCSSVVVLLDPDPVTLVHGSAHWPIYNDPAVSIQSLLAAGVDAVLRIKLSEHNLDSGAAELFEVLYKHISIKECWLGSRQTLGRGAKGDFSAIDAVAERYNIIFVRISGSTGPALQWHLRQLLVSGCLMPAINAVCKPPIWSRPRSGITRVAWGAGVYRAAQVPDISSLKCISPLTVELLAGSDGLSYFRWPKMEAQYLAFLSGPNDAGR
jgi:hypothetical protein